MKSIAGISPMLGKGSAPRGLSAGPKGRGILPRLGATEPGRGHLGEGSRRSRGELSGDRLKENRPTENLQAGNPQAEVHPPDQQRGKDVSAEENVSAKVEGAEEEETWTRGTKTPLDEVGELVARFSEDGYEIRRLPADKFTVDDPINPRIRWIENNLEVELNRAEFNIGIKEGLAMLQPSWTEYRFPSTFLYFGITSREPGGKPYPEKRISSIAIAETKGRNTTIRYFEYANLNDSSRMEQALHAMFTSGGGKYEFQGYPHRAVRDAATRLVKAKWNRARAHALNQIAVNRQPYSPVKLKAMDDNIRRLNREYNKAMIEALDEIAWHNEADPRLAHLLPGSLRRLSEFIYLNKLFEWVDKEHLVLIESDFVPADLVKHFENPQIGVQRVIDAIKQKNGEPPADAPAFKKMAQDADSEVHEGIVQTRLEDGSSVRMKVRWMQHPNGAITLERVTVLNPGQDDITFSARNAPPDGSAFMMKPDA